MRSLFGSPLKLFSTILFGLGIPILVAALFLRFNQQQYTIYVDDEVTLVRGSFDTVGDVLNSAGVAILPGDLVVPASAESINPSTAIQIMRAHSIEVITDDGQSTYTTHQPSLSAFLSEANIIIGRTEQVNADGDVLGFGELDSAEIPQQLAIGRYHTITIIDGDTRTEVTTSAETVGAALQESNISIFAADGVEPPMGSWISQGLEVTITRSKPLTIMVDGRTVQTRSHFSDAYSVLAEAGIGLVGYDYVRPDPSVQLQPNDTIEVVRVTEDFIIEDTTIPYETVWQASEQLEIDTTGILVAGKAGIARKRTRVRYENGTEISRTPDGEWVEAQPVNEVLGYGTNVVVRTLDTPEGPIEYWRKVEMRVTSYTAASSGKAPDHPAYGITASGVLAGTGVVAIDKTVVPFRTNVYVPGYGVGFAGDTGGGVIGRWIDLGYDEDEYIGWRGYVDVYYLTPVPEPERINFLIPTWLP